VPEIAPLVINVCMGLFRTTLEIFAAIYRKADRIHSQIPNKEPDASSGSQSRAGQLHELEMQLRLPKSEQKE